MATDGVKIIDGDLSRDTYNRIMDLYDSEAALATILEEVPFEKTDYGDDTDFYHEQFVTAYALAFWEIGALQEHLLEEVRRVIALGAGVKDWTEAAGEKEGRKRQRVLETFYQKISQPNPKVRQRKKYRIITTLFFQPDDVLTFQLSNGNYHVVICAKVTQKRGLCTYDLVPTNYASPQKPTAAELSGLMIAGHLMGSGFSAEQTLAMQPGLDAIWRYMRGGNFLFGLPYQLVPHRDFLAFKHRFEVVGKLRIKEPFKKDGGYGYYMDFDAFESSYSDLEADFRIFGTQLFPVSLLCESLDE